MAIMEPTVALVTCEQALRQLMGAVFASNFGDDWIGKVASEKDVSAWRERRTTEVAKRTTRGVMDVPQNELAYAEFYQLREIADRHWNLLTGALGAKKETGALLKRFDDLRNTVAHSRDLLPFEADLLSGIAGEIRNRVTKFMSAQDPAGEYYPRIESVTDSFGNRADRMFARHTNVTLRPGDRIAFACRGTDPHGRELRWQLVVPLSRGDAKDFLGLRIQREVEATGDEVTLEWHVADDNVMEAAEVVVRLTALGSKYHRLPHCDDYLKMLYSVAPPLEAFPNRAA